jgi:hypothetical protein
MKLPLSTIAALCLTTLALQHPVHAADVELGLTLVTELAQVNGVALACQDMTTAAQAKKLMLAHAPKTPRFGSAYEEATNASYLNQTRTAAACPDSVAVNSKLDALAKRLRDALPPALPSAQ